MLFELWLKCFWRRFFLFFTFNIPNWIKWAVGLSTFLPADGACYQLYNANHWHQTRYLFFFFFLRQWNSWLQVSLPGTLWDTGLAQNICLGFCVHHHAVFWFCILSTKQEPKSLTHLWLFTAATLVFGSGGDETPWPVYSCIGLFSWLTA